MRLACILLLFAASVPAQRIEGRFTAGVTSFADDAAINHLTAGGSARFYFSRRWSVEPEYLYMRHNGAFTRDRDHVLWGNVAFDFRRRDRVVIPYWFAAPGVIHHSSSFGQFRFTTTEAAVASGAGVKLLFGRLLLAPQFRFGLADGIFAEVTGSIGFVLKP